jgi:hypothetical protein
MRLSRVLAMTVVGHVPILAYDFQEYAGGVGEGEPVIQDDR